jgi:hypothetical protein
MNVIGFGLDKIEAKKIKPLDGNLKISTNIQIKEIKEEKVALLKDDFILRFDFEFIINYTPEIANLKFNGFLVVSAEKELGKKIIKEWKNKKMGEDLKIELLNFIISKISIKALQIEDDLDLPYHIPFPKVSKLQEK